MINVRIAICILVLMAGFYLDAEEAVEQPGIEEEEIEYVMSAADSLCAERGHIILDSEIYQVTRDNVLPWVVDYGDSVVVYFFEKNIRHGTLERCARCGRWIGVPKMENALTYVAWRQAAKQDSLEE